MTEPTKAHRSPASFSIASILAVLAAIFSFFVNPIFGMILAAVAVIAGLFGVIIALSPSRRGGFASTFAVIAGVIGVIVAIIKAFVWILSGI